MRIVLASNNPGKAREFSAVLADFHLESPVSPCIGRCAFQRDHFSQG